ncbi:MAG: hypothetical protein R3C41_20440 [Calditrichia bacterium]
MAQPIQPRRCRACWDIMNLIWMNNKILQLDLLVDVELAGVAGEFEGQGNISIITIKQPTITLTAPPKQEPKRTVKV